MDTTQIPLTQSQSSTLTVDQQYLGNFVTADLDQIFNNRTVTLNSQSYSLQKTQVQEYINQLRDTPCNSLEGWLLKKRVTIELYTDLTFLNAYLPGADEKTRNAMLLELQSIIASWDAPFVPGIFSKLAEGSNTSSDMVKQCTQGLATLIIDCFNNFCPEIQMHMALTRTGIITLPNIDAYYIDFFFSNLLKFYEEVLNHSLSMLYNVGNVGIPAKVKAVVIYRIATQLCQEVTDRAFSIDILTMKKKLY